MASIAIELNISQIKFKFSAQYEREHTFRETVFTSSVISSPPLTSTLLFLLQNIMHVKIHEHINRKNTGSKTPNNAFRPKNNCTFAKKMIVKKLMHTQEQMLHTQVVHGCKFVSQHTFPIIIIMNLTILGINVNKVNIKSKAEYIKKKVSKERWRDS